jgi:hypothetical protein
MLKGENNSHAHNAARRPCSKTPASTAYDATDLEHINQSRGDGMVQRADVLGDLLHDYYRKAM